MRRVPHLHRLTTAICLTTAISTALAQTPETDSTATYGADFFEGSGALTVNDMLDRVPGIEMILQATNVSSVSSDGNRGLGATSQILIDGKRMAGKANLIKDVLRKTLADDEALQGELMVQYQAFKENLIHDITPEDFSDIYAETIAYGMFAARLHDTTLDTFSRQEALELLPKSNPFLRSLFSYVAGYDLDDRIVWIIDDLARVFQACDVAKLMENFGKLTGQNDPFLHFYETFLAAYNPSKRKARGVWYTPEPVVNFIVRAVDGVECRGGQDRIIRISATCIRR